MKVAAVQFRPEYSQPAINRDTAVRMILVAIQQGAKLIVLPELCLSGYSMMGFHEAFPLSETVGEGETFRLFQELAVQHGVAIVWGFAERVADDSVPDRLFRLYNSQAIVLPNGNYSTYRKVNRWGQDFLWAEAGKDSPPIVGLYGHQVGLLICRDVRDKGPGMDDFYEPGDADIVAFSTNWGNGGFPANRWIEFAESNKTWLVVANRYGREANNDFGEGGSCIISPNNKVTCEGLAWSAPCIVYAEVP